MGCVMGKGYWTGKAFSKEGKGKAETPKRGKVRVDKCDVCRQPQGKCKCSDQHKVLIRHAKGTDGGRKVTNYTLANKNPNVVWCGACSCRVFSNGTCSNVTCSTRKGR